MPDGLNICLVEDNELLREAVATMLRAKGHIVASHAAGNEGLQAAIAQNFDAVVTDVNLPDVSALTMIAKIKKRKPKLPIITMSGASARSSDCPIDVLHKSGAARFLAKPFRASELLDALEEARPPGPERLSA